MHLLKNVIAGKPADSASPSHIDVVDPYTEQVIAQTPRGCEKDVDDAVRAATEAQPGWAGTPVPERLELIRRAGQGLRRHAAELAVLESREMGRPTLVGERFVSASIEGFIASTEVAATYPFVGDVSAPGEVSRTIVHRRPLGVVALVVPWNFTVSSILGPLGSLLAAGNTVVVKPSEKAPISASRLIELLDLPPGVVNLVHGDAHAGRPLVSHEGVALAHFTGSVETGRSVGVAGAQRLHRSVLELGGKDAVIVDADVDVAATARAVAESSFLNTGQICTSSERIYVQRAIAEDFLTALVAAAAEYPMVTSSAEIGIGPMVDGAQRAIVDAHVTDAIARGATVHCGGVIPVRTGFFYPATVLSGVTQDMRIMREETFGPVAPVSVFDSFDEAIALANDSEFGLAATVYSHDPEHLARSADLNAAIVWINEWQAGGANMIHEPWGSSGVGITGGQALLDAATRPVSVISPSS